MIFLCFGEGARERARKMNRIGVREEKPFATGFTHPRHQRIVLASPASGKRAGADYTYALVRGSNFAGAIARGVINDDDLERYARLRD